MTTLLCYLNVVVTFRLSDYNTIIVFELIGDCGALVIGNSQFQETKGDAPNQANLPLNYHHGKKSKKQRKEHHTIFFGAQPSHPIIGAILLELLL